jgi:hypothetical protein
MPHAGPSGPLQLLGFLKQEPPAMPLRPKTGSWLESLCNEALKKLKRRCSEWKKKQRTLAQGNLIPQKTIDVF